MSLVNQKLAALAVNLLALSCLGAGEPPAQTWQAGPGFKWAELAVPQRGKTGFTLLGPGETGLSFTNRLGEAASAANRVLENGSGVAAGDFDRDGRPDLFFCSLAGQSALYRNLGNWKFEEVTRAAGIDVTRMVARGAVFADVNGDGWPDLLISTLGSGVLCLFNEGNGRFSPWRSIDPGARLGSMTLALADVDGNGTLDLYVTNYRTDDIRDRSRIDIQRVNGQLAVAPWLRDRLVLTSEGVREFGEPDLLYLNDGQGQFTPAPWTGGTFLDESGQPLSAAPLDWGLTASFRDLNGNGSPDLYVCNDYWTPDRIWINNGQGRFQAIPTLAIRQTSENSMGVDFADIDRDGHVDFLVLDMLSRDPAMRKRQVLAQSRMPPGSPELGDRPQIMRNTLFWNRGDGTFAQIADYAGLPASDWSWQPVFIDVDLDGYEDLIIPAGHRRDVQDLDATRLIRSLQRPWPKGMDAKTHQEAFTRQMLEHARLYPTLEMPVVAFRNLGDLRFQEVTDQWGTSALGVHQGIALGDFDGDGDLDFVVSNLNGVCGVYRNDSIAARVAVRLKGLRPNTDGVGARVTLRGGAVPSQSQELLSGGRYLSGFQGQLVFASGNSSGRMILEVTWRSGRRSVVEQVRPNRLYEIDEAGAALSESPGQPRALPAPASGALFNDASHLLHHRHVENPFDDWARQPLLPRKLSQLGPGICWYDLDQDGHEDLIIGSGRGGQLRIYANTGQGAFRTNAPGPILTRDLTGLAALRTRSGQTVVLAGSANYEDGLATGLSVYLFDASGKPVAHSFPGALSSTGPLALADYNGDGELDLFVGGRVIPARYPEPASSRLFRQINGFWQIDETNSRLLEHVGLVSGACWSDLNGDGFPELILACEWGPLRVFGNHAGQLREMTAEYGLAQQTGWWAGVSTGDFDGDGRMDIVAANWGLNSSYQAAPEQPLRLYYGDFMRRGTVELLETEWDPQRRTWTPRHRLDFVAAGLPFLHERFSTYKAFSEATVEEVLADLLPQARVADATTLASTVFLNRGDRFDPIPLPSEAQLAPAFSVNVADFDGDGHEDVFLSQNFFDLPWEMHRLDAGRGLLLQGRGDGRFRAEPGPESGIAVYGQQRGAATADFNNDGRVDLVVTQNGAETKLFQNIGATAGLRVRLTGPAGNPQAIGAVLRLGSGGRYGAAREVRSGSGYLSQDSAVQVMAAPQTPETLWVRWPGGSTTTHPVASGVREVTLVHPGNAPRPD